MGKTKANSKFKRSMGMPVCRFYCFFIFTFLLFFPFLTLFSQDEPEYDEISVFIDIPRLGGGEISAVIKGEEIFLPVTDLFDFIKIKNTPSPDLEMITGFYITQDAAFNIDRLKNNISLGDKKFDLDPGSLIRTETNLYLRSDYLGKIFGLDCIFSFRNLSVTLNTKLELPAIREMRQEAMRKNITRLKGEIKADTTIGRSYPGFHFGMADWSAIATEEINGRSEARLNLSLGSIIAGGETTASLNYSTSDPFLEKQQHYLWRRVNNDNKALRQIMAGKIFTRAASSIYNPVVGVQFTNTPTTFRRSFGSYTLSDRTEPGWIVELYVNNVIVDYAEADGSGFFTFEVPLVYGNTFVMLKFYGPWGEERTREQNILIPFSFIPKNTLEYTVSAGVVEDTLFSRFSRTIVNYGLTRYITLGAGYEYLSSVSSGAFMPFSTASIRVTPNLLLSGEYMHTVRTKGTLTYRLPSNIQFDLNYINYAKDQKAINYNYLEERKATVSMPLRIKNYSLYNRLSVNQLVLPNINYTTGEWLLSGSLFGVNTNITTYGLFIGKITPYIYSNYALSIHLPLEITFLPQAQFGYTDKRLISVKTGLEKRMLKHGFLSLSYEQNFRNNMHLGELGFRYDFKFAQAGSSVRQTDKVTSFIQYARGSLINDRRQTGYLGADNRPNVGRGGISVIPFLDVNANNRKDPGEPKVYGLNVRASGGTITRSEKDTIIHILGLEPYTDCFIELDENGFDNFAWRLKNRTMNIAVDPNMLKLIEIPVIVAGEASGNVMIEKDDGLTGIGRMIVNFYSGGNQTARTLTEQDGYFSLFGLTTGAYTVRVDSVQLNKLGMLSSPDSINFNINASIDGDFVEGLDFTLKMKFGDTAIIATATPQKPVSRKDTAYMIIHEVTQELVTITKDSYAIQFGAFRLKSNADAMRTRIQALLGKNVEIVLEDDFYKVRILDLEDRKEVDEKIAILLQNGVTEVWVISLKAKQQQLVLVEKQDTVRTITETLIGKDSLEFIPEMSIQMGIFRDKSNALGLIKVLRAKYGNKIKMVYENNFYKIVLLGSPIIKQTVLEEMYKLEPSIGKLKFKDTWVLPPPELIEDEPAVIQRELPLKTVEWNKEIPSVLETATTSKLVKGTIVAPVPHPEPTISLQVLVTGSKIQAQTAKRKIIHKLSLPVEIVQEYDVYKVIISGFYTREETYKYYPELAGLGYPNINMIIAQ